MGVSQGGESSGVGRSAKAKVSIADVARTAGVSVGTVSNVLNRPDRVSPATRKRVQQTISRLSFVPNASARQLRAGTPTTVGMIVLDIGNPFFTDMTRGVEDRIAQDDLALMLASSDGDPAREARYLKLFEQHGVAGLLVVPSGDDIQALLELAGRGVTVVLLDSPSPLTGTPTVAGLSSVSADDVAGGRLAVEHLLGLGHDEVVMFNGSHDIHQCRDRYAGAFAAFVDAGLDPERGLMERAVSSLDATGGEDALGRWLVEHGDRPPRAVFCVNDVVAIGVQRTLRHRELYRDVAIVGYDDIDIVSELATPLTSVRQPRREMGARGADLLLRTPGPHAVERVVFQPELVARASTLQA